MNLDGFTEFDLLKSKGIDKTKLVQVKVTVQGKNGTFTRMQWKRPSDVTGSDVVVGGQQNLVNTPKKDAQQSNTPNVKHQLVDLLSKHGRQSVMDFAEKNGVDWKKNSHEGINWMRASMAIQKHMQSNPKVWESFGGKDSTPSDNKTQTDSKASSTTQSTSKDTNSAKDVKASSSASPSIDKQKVKALTSGKDKSKVLDSLKANGVTWNEHSHAGINWMRAMQAFGKALAENPSLEDKMKADKTAQDLKTTQKQLKDTQKQVAELKDLVSQIQNPTAQQSAAASAKSSVLNGITTDTMSTYEKKNFGDAISKASPESLRNYRTLGMCAGDKESEKYLADLYEKYSAAVQGTTQKYDPNIDADPLRNKLQGVVNKMIVGAVKSSLKNARKRSGDFTMQQKLMEPWVDPNKQLTDEEKYAITHPDRSAASMIGTLRQDACRETDCNHEMFHRVLDKFKMSKEYGQLAEEYDKMLTEYDKLTRGSSVLQNETNSAGNCHEVIFKERYTDPAKCKKSVDGAIQRERDRLTSNIERNKANLKTAKPGQPYAKKIEALIASEEDKLKELDKLTGISGEDMVKANELRRKLFDPKFTDLNVNLYHHKMMANQLAYQYFINKDFISEYPILSKDNLDKLDKADEDSLTNLALYAGMFKPSLTKGGKSAKDALLDKYSERQAFLDAYGGVTQVSGNASYAENNEIKCKVSKASDKVTKKITDNIARDWDMRTHGNMKYKIKGVYEVSGLAIEKDFDKIKKDHSKYSKSTSGGKNCGSDLFYHGTGSMATSLILGHSGEFKIVKAKVGRMLGDGIYLADKSSKSAQYISDSGYSRHGISGSLMVVEASLGDTLHARTNQGYSHDSVFAGKTDGLLNNEWCVHDTKAVIPRYLVEMEIV